MGGEVFLILIDRLIDWVHEWCETYYVWRSGVLEDAWRLGSEECGELPEPAYLSRNKENDSTAL